MTDTHGGCFCGDLRFTATLPSQWVAHCHCSMCQRAHGAPVVTWVGLREDRARIDDPHGRLRWFDSTPGIAQRGFCERCGTTLLFRSSRWPGELHVVRTAFDGPVDREPQVHVNWATHAPWLLIGEDGLPRKADIGG